jgi:N-acetylated-alpha-linked acidic dipeptidase
MALLRGLLRVVCGMCAVVAAATTASADSAVSIYGFSASGAERELALERSFDQSLSAADLRAWMRRMAAEPNQVGSPHDRANAEFMLEQFRSWGWQAEIETFYVLYPTPKQELLELLAPQHYRAKLHEPPVAGDRSSQISRDVLTGT